MIPKILGLEKTLSYSWSQTTKILCICLWRELLLLTWTIYWKELILQAFWKQIYNHRIKYIIFKSSSSKYNKVLQYYMVHSISFQTFFVQAFKIVVDSWKFTMLLLYILWDDWPIFMISHSNEQLQQQLEYTLLKPDCHSWWISKMQFGREDTLEPTICTMYQDHPYFLDALWSQTNIQLSLWLSSMQTFISQQRLHQHDTSTAILLSNIFHIWFAQ